MRRIFFLALACCGLAPFLSSSLISQPILFSPVAGYEYGALTSISRDSGVINPYRSVEGFGTSYNTTIWIGVEAAAHDIIQDRLDIALRADIGFGIGRFTSHPYSWKLARVESPADSIDAINELHVQSSQTLARVEATVALRPFGGLMVTAGPWASFRFGSSVFVTELMREPFDRVFQETLLRERTLSTRRELESDPLRFGGHAGIGYEIPIASILTLRPMVGMRWDTRAFLDNLGSLSWSADAGIAVTFDLTPREILVPAELPDSVFVITGHSNIKATVNLFNADPAALDSSVASVHLQRTRYDLYVPLAPFVFFEPQSHELPARYTRMPREIADTIASLPYEEREPVAVYRNLLNVLGIRMRTEAQTSITLTGVGTAAEASGLGRTRAEEVREYLHRIWRIDTHRILITSTAAQGCSPAATAYVRIVPSRSTLLAPMVSKWLVEDHILPPMGLTRKIRSELGVKQWNIAINQGDRQLVRFEHDGEINPEISTALPTTQLVLDSSAEPLTAVLNVTDFSGEASTVHDELRLHLIDNGSAPNRTVRTYLLFEPQPRCPDYLSNNHVLTSNLLSAIEPGALLRVLSRSEPGQGWSASVIGSELLKLTNTRTVDAREIRIVNETSATTEGAYPEEAIYARAIRLVLEQSPRDKSSR